MLCCCDTFPSHAWVTPVSPCASVSFCVTPRRLCIPAPSSCSCLRCNRKLGVESAWLPSPLAVATWRRTGMPRGAPTVSLPAPAQRFLSSRTWAGGWSQGEAWQAGLLAGAPRSQAVGSCHALMTCSCPGVLLQINKRLSAYKLSEVYPQGLLLPEPATPAAAQGVLQGAGLALCASLSPLEASTPSSPWGLASGDLRRSEDSWGASAGRGLEPSEAIL